MKSKISSLSTLAIALLMASCAADDDLSVSSVDSDVSNVTFTVAQPGDVQTRAYSDGTSASTLYYSVYQVTDDGLKYLSDLSDSETNAFDSNLQATVTLQLVNGNEYDVIFWAQSPDTEVYTRDFDSTEPSVSLASTLVSNTEYYDAFYKFHEVGVVTGDISETIQLTRPFAQLNWGTDDLDAVYAAEVSNLQTSVTITGGVGTSLTFSDGSVELNEEAFTFGVNSEYGIPDEDEAFPVSGYDYLNMNYILFTADKATVDATLTITGDNFTGNTVEVSSVPLQRNYRTNIFGSLLTSTVEYTIEIVPEYEEPDYAAVSTGDALLAAIEAGSTDIRLFGDITLDEDIEFDYDATLYVYDYTITSSGMITVTDGASLTIVGSTDDDGEAEGELVLTNGYLYAAGEESTLTIENVTITNTGLPSNANGAVQIGATNVTSSDNTLVMNNVTISSIKSGVVLAGSTTVTLEDCDITTDYFGITQQGTGNSYVTPGSTVTLTDTNITAKYSGIYFSTSYGTVVGNTSNITITGGTITSQEESAIEVKRTNLTVSGATLVAEYSGAQKYVYSGSGSNSYGYGITLAGYSTSTAYEGDVSLSNVTYNLSSSANTYDDGITEVWNVVEFVEANTTGTAPDDAYLTGTKTSSGTTTYTYSKQVTDDGATE